MCQNIIFDFSLSFIISQIFFVEENLAQNCIEITKFYLLFAFRNFSAISGKLNFSYPIFFMSRLINFPTLSKNY